MRESSSASSPDFVNLVTLRGGDRQLSGTLVGRRSEQRLVQIDEHRVDVPPSENMLMVKNDDRPGVIGLVGTTLGNAGVNIADMDVGRAKVQGTAVMLIAPTAAVPDGGRRSSSAPRPGSSPSTSSPGSQPPSAAAWIAARSSLTIPSTAAIARLRRSGSGSLIISFIPTGTTCHDSP